jgi:hypothetical protein
MKKTTGQFWELLVCYVKHQHLMDKKGVENKRLFSDILKRKEGAKPWKRENG